MTFKLEQAADYLCLHPETVRCRAKAGIIPASKPGRRWVFLQHELETYLKQCRSTAGGTSGGSTSSIEASVYASRARQIIETSHSAFTIRSVPACGTRALVALRSTAHLGKKKPRTAEHQMRLWASRRANAAMQKVAA